MMEIGLAGRMGERPIRDRSLNLLDHCGEPEPPARPGRKIVDLGDQRKTLGARHEPDPRAKRFRSLDHAGAIVGEPIDRPLRRGREVEFQIAGARSRTQEELEAGVSPQAGRARRFGPGRQLQVADRSGELVVQLEGGRARPLQLRHDPLYGRAGSIGMGSQPDIHIFVIARSEATKQSSFAQIPLDCFAALAMTGSGTGLAILQPRANRPAMAEYRSELLRTLSGRGYVHQVTDPAGLDSLAGKEIVPGYVGFDATASSLHVGNLVSIMMLRRLQQAGHKPIVVMGGGTTKIGDPSGKDESRKLLTDEAIAANIVSIRRSFEHFLTFGDGPTDAILVNNANWLDTLDYIPFLRDVGPHFTINRMLTFDSVKLRLEREQPLTFLEFNYMILQAYDFLELSRRAECRLQLGGSDQWGNIVNGIELARRIDGTQVYGVTTPLITTADGGKMGKTAKGAVWLAAEMLGPYDYWQFWRNTRDADVGKFLRLYTDMELDEIARLEKLQGAEINDAKKAL